MSFNSHGITKPNYSNGIITVFYRFSTYILGYAFNPIRLLTTRCDHIFRHDHQTPQSGFFIQTLSSYGTGLNRTKWFSFLNTFLYLSYGSLKRCWDQILLPITLISNQFHICFILQPDILYALHILSFLFLSCRQ